MIIRYHRDFQKHTRKFLDKKKSITEAIEIFMTNPADSRLKTHQLSGSLSGYWSFSVDYHLRILFRFISKEEVLFLDTGTHGVYQ